MVMNRLLILLSASVLVICPLPVSQAQVPTTITSSGLNTRVGSPTTLAPGTVNYDITGGTRPGNGPNLFHSFGEFSVATKNIANFLNETGLPTTNILSRVTGGHLEHLRDTADDQFRDRESVSDQSRWGDFGAHRPTERRGVRPRQYRGLFAAERQRQVQCHAGTIGCAAQRRPGRRLWVPRPDGRAHQRPRRS